MIKNSMMGILDLVQMYFILVLLYLYINFVKNWLYCLFQEEERANKELGKGGK